MKDRHQLWIFIRIGIVFFVLFGLFGVVLTRAYRLQTVHQDRLKRLAEEQYLKETEIKSRRGTIYDRNGSPLAVSAEVDSVYANPRVVGERRSEVARKLAAVLQVDVHTLEKRLTKRSYFCWIKRRITPDQAQAVKALELPGISFKKEYRRFYPHQGLGSTVVGFVGFDSEGLSGLELQYDKWLNGPSMRIKGLRDSLGRDVLSEGFGISDAAGTAHQLISTLDRSIQFYAEQALSEAYPHVDPQIGWITTVVMEPNSGDILAMANAPSFDPNQYRQSEIRSRRNRAVADTFEPGSTIKVFTAAAALQAGVVTTAEQFDTSGGSWRVGRHVIHDSHAHGKLDLAGIIQKSSNIGISKVALRLGKERLYRWLNSFGFGQPSGSGLLGERRGVLRSASKWSNVGLANISFGQGMTSTALQLARGLSMLGNGGYLVQPRSIKEIRDARGQVVHTYQKQRTRVLEQRVVGQIRQMMTRVTEPGGTAKAAALEHYTVAGKTGTAQKVDPATGAYSKDHWVSSFMGLVPASKPKLAIVVVVNEPRGKKYYGGEVAGPIFKKIATNSLRYLNVSPDLTRKEVAGYSKKGSNMLSAEQGSNPKAVAPALPSTDALSQLSNRGITVPDFTGLSMLEVVTKAHELKLELEFRGSGVAVSQTPGPGERGNACTVLFRPPT